MGARGGHVPLLHELLVVPVDRAERVALQHWRGEGERGRCRLPSSLS